MVHGLRLPFLAGLLSLSLVSPGVAGSLCGVEEISGAISRENSNPVPRFFAADGVLYVLANLDVGGAMFITDGTPGSVRQINLPPGSDTFQPGSDVLPFNDSLFFGYRPNDTIGRELHRLRPNGQVQLVIDLDPDPPSPFGGDGNGFAGVLRTDGDRVFFEGDEKVRELSRSNNVYTTTGTGAQLFGPDLNDPDTVGPINLADLFVLNGNAYITGRPMATEPVQLWRGDGTSWTPIATLPSFNIAWWEQGDSIAYFAIDGAVWRTNGSSGGTYKVTAEGTELTVIGSRRAVFGDSLVFSATGGLWHSAGGLGDARIILPQDEGNASVYGPVGNRVVVYYDPAATGEPHETLVVQASGTVSTLADFIGLPEDAIAPPPASRSFVPPPVETANGGMVFEASPFLWYTDFTPGGTYMICDQFVSGAAYGVQGNHVITILRRASNRDEHVFVRIPIQRLDGTPTPTPTTTPTPTPPPTTVGPPPGPFNVISPSGRTIVESESTTFLWEPSDNAATYRVLVISPFEGMGGQTVFSSPEVEGTSLTINNLPTTLYSDRPYTWMVEAKTLDGQTRDSNNEAQFFQERADAAGLRTLLEILGEGDEEAPDENGDLLYDAADLILVLAGVRPEI